MNKICTKCGEEKPNTSEFFYVKNRYKSGLDSSCKDCCKEYCRENKDRKAAYDKIWYEKNKLKQAEHNKKSYEENKEKRFEYQNNRRQNDEKLRTRLYLSSSLATTLKRSGAVKKNKTMTYVGCSKEELLLHLQSTKKPEWEDEQLHIDHIIPSSLYDHSNEDEIYKCWNWRNLRYLPAEENISKGNKLDMELVEEYNITDLLPEELYEL